ncbi:Aste57867_13828 [Aphanomyces stellatus]|uniref:Aste57867_13828 protein n=1 Tax=Aphanomyces stellatus TaxID=120398 RepID=A0A485L015_9STRA|nr:hypothetical protein As57867_013778 [Aphanomyces stellatus]VFT90660.1 Aste57867_13828 [Aphanomyces stellatus]
MYQSIILFHLISFVFAVVAFVVAVALVSIGVATTPLFCIGVLVLQVLLYAIYFFAQCDARLYNCIAPADEHIITVQFDVPRHGLYHLQGNSLSPTISNVSKESLLAIFYFDFLIFPLAVAGSGTLIVLVSVSVALIVVPCFHPHVMDETFM